ncbi:hypothetical protein [Bacteroides uniformis]|uniref:hypothetical protein n=1 Tax=Bacteroides uniformis TaxID=820 RepID=UPI00232D9478|nr:hypothetical protein [Bacteroides uniformis]MDC1818837.1 hypothetical protein [Bacteroides uniformis]
MSIFYMLLILSLWGCEAVPQTVVSIDTEQVVNEDYIGNGAQWDPYQLEYSKGRLEISEADWEKMYHRLDFMRPQFIRVMTNTTSVMKDGILHPEQGLEHLSHILNYCQTRNVTVMFGDWGGSLVDSHKETINEENLTAAAEYVRFLIEEKGFSCIRYYNLINEPNGYWSATNGKYSLWARAIRFFHKKLKENKLTDKLQIIGPDVAIWSTHESWWTDSCATHLNNEIGLYDIHTYPSKSTVNSGAYTDIIRAYKQSVPADKKIVMGEIGFKFVAPEDSLFQQENLRRAEAKPHASMDDSQMFVYDSMYGTDMADALFQTINAGYSGSVVWMLDDAMHSKEAPDKLKIWGFWNIFGEEQFGSEEEEVRPWFYAWSLLTRYMPAGSRAYKVYVEGDSCIKAIAVEKGGNHMLAVVNVSKEKKTVMLKSSTLPLLKEVKEYLYAEGQLKKEGDCRLLPHRQGVTLHLDKGETIRMSGESLTVYTNFDY